MAVPMRQERHSSPPGMDPALDMPRSQCQTPAGSAVSAAPEFAHHREPDPGFDTMTVASLSPKKGGDKLIAEEGFSFLRVRGRWLWGGREGGFEGLLGLWDRGQ